MKKPLTEEQISLLKKKDEVKTHIDQNFKRKLKSVMEKFGLGNDPEALQTATYLALTGETGTPQPPETAEPDAQTKALQKAFHADPSKVLLMMDGALRHQPTQHRTTPKPKKRKQSDRKTDEDILSYVLRKKREGGRNAK